MTEHPAVPPLRRIEAALLGIMRTTATRRAHGRWTKQAGIDIGYVEFRILSAVCSAGRARSSEIAKLLDIEPPLVSREVGRLEDQGLVIRTPDGSDGRVRNIEATPAGRKIHERYRATLEMNIDAALRAWSESELEQLAVLLERFANDVTRPQSGARR
jgi:DNA-binding MarR family transcriptional regulator